MGAVTAKTPSNKGDEILESKSNFTVIKGEEAPVMGDCGPVNGVAKKQCAMTIPYKVEGEKQSELEIIVEGPDGKVLKMGKDANLTVHGDRIQLDLINPTREKSGKYKVTMKNAQGKCEKYIDVNIMDKPTPPLSIKVSNVFCDNCVVAWSPPQDDGGTPIKKYIVEAMDTTSGNGTWSPVASTDDGGTKKIKVEHLTQGHRYRFRVIAVNKIGPSDPGEMKGDDILMKDPWDEPGPCANLTSSIGAPTMQTLPGLLQRQMVVLPSLITSLNSARRIWDSGFTERPCLSRRLKPWATRSRVKLMV